MAETRSLISKLLKNCTILNNYRKCIFLAMKCIMEHRCKEISEPFTSYMDKVLTTVMTWHSRILPIRNKMSSCGYDKFCTHSATIRKMTDEYFAKVHILKEDLQKELQMQTEEKKSSQGQMPNLASPSNSNRRTIPTLDHLGSLTLSQCYRMNWT